MNVQGTRNNRQVAIDFMLDGEDVLTSDMHQSNTYNKQYRSQLFSESNILKNIKEAARAIKAADTVIENADKFSTI